jgi:outer membrane protein assembly factor BamB
MSNDDLLFIGTHGHICAVDKRSGDQIWTKSLPDTGYAIVTLLYEDDVLYAGSRGHLFAIDPADGTILWSNGLKGLGYDHICLLTTKTAPQSHAELLAAAAASDRSKNSSSGTTHT